MPIFDLKILFIFWLIINVLTFCLYFIDKRLAIKQKWRISEDVLLIFALFYGAIGAVMSMLLFRHKTRKTKFIIAIPVFILINLASIYYFISYFL